MARSFSRAALALCCLLGFVAPVSASDSFTADALRGHCMGETPFDKALCLGYVSGTLYGYSLGSMEQTGGVPPYCPVGETGQVRFVQADFVDWLPANPEFEQQDAALALVAMLKVVTIFLAIEIKGSKMNELIDKSKVQAEVSRVFEQIDGASLKGLVATHYAFIQSEQFLATMAGYYDPEDEDELSRIGGSMQLFATICGRISAYVIERLEAEIPLDEHEAATKARVLAEWELHVGNEVRALKHLAGALDDLPDECTRTIVMAGKSTQGLSWQNLPRSEQVRTLRPVNLRTSGGVLLAFLSLFAVPVALFTMEISWVLVAVFSLLGCVLCFRAAARKYQDVRQKFEAKVSAIQDRIDAEPGQVRPVWDLAQAKLEDYLDRNLSQVGSIYYLALSAMVVGFGFIGWGILIAYQVPGDGWIRGIVSMSAGVIVEFLTATVLVIYRSTVAQAQSYVGVLERINAVGMALHVLDGIGDDNTELSERTRAELAKTLIDLMVQKET
eukprot:s1_g89.t1